MRAGERGRGGGATGTLGARGGSVGGRRDAVVVVGVVVVVVVVGVVLAVEALALGAAHEPRLEALAVLLQATALTTMASLERKWVVARKRGI